jgi:pSer/pThr/pTyr-binding forkhead associated (FHA) protein
MSLRLTAVDSELTIELHPGATLVIGRAPSCDAPVVDSTVSRRHAELDATGAGFEVRDLGSSNGTYVNDARVERAALNAGDVVRFGKVRFRVGELPTLREVRAAVTTPLSAGAVGGGRRTVMRPVFVDAATPASAPVAGAGAPAAAQHADARERRLRTLLDVSKQLTRAASVDALLARIVDVCFNTFDADRVALMLGGTAA